VHGGAVPVESVRLVEMGLVDRETTAIEEKLRIARAALGILPHNSGTTILLDAGTTVARLADILPVGAIQTVVTDSVPIAAGLSARLVADVQLLGGSVRGITQATVGAITVEALSSLRVDIAFIGTNGFSLGHALSTPDPGEAAVKRAMALSARRVIVLADSSKYGADYLVRFASWDQIDTLVTDSALPPEARRALLDRGIEVVIA
jgi:DeoR family fructose operon transcriptional repressor